VAGSHYFQIAFSPDSSLLASGSNDKVIRLWKVSDGSLVRTMEGHKEPIRCIAFSPDGSRLASGSDDQTIRLWRVSDGSLVRVIEAKAGTGSIFSIAFSPDGSLLASASSDALQLWEVSDGSLIRELQGGGKNVAFSPDGILLASGSGEEVFLRKVSDGTLVRPQGDNLHIISDIDFSPDGSSLAAGLFGGSVHLWNLEDGNMVWKLQPDPDDSVGAISFSPDSSLIAYATYPRNNFPGLKFIPGSIRLCKVIDGSLLLKISLINLEAVDNITFSPDGKFLALGTNWNIQLWAVPPE